MEQTCLQILFWTLVFLLVYPFAVYPLLILFAGSLRGKSIRKEDQTPAVSLIITAYNEEERIGQKLENSLALDYPPDQLEIIVASDASDDQTGDIVSSYADRGVKLVELETRGGKSLAQNAGIAEATGEVIVHTDATTMIPSGGLKKLVRGFADPSVGCITSHDQSVGESGTAVETAGLYTRFEIAVRNAETMLSGVISVSGSFYGVRKELRPPLPAHIIDDFMIPLNVIKNSYRVIAEPEAVGIVQRSKNVAQEYSRKVRTFLTGMLVFFRCLGLLNPFRTGWVSFQLFSHKLARWLMPFLLAGLFVTSIFLSPVHWVYTLALAGFIFIILCALTGQVFKEIGGPAGKVFRIARYLFLVNAALLSAWWKMARGEKLATWEPTRR